MSDQEVQEEKSLLKVIPTEFTKKRFKHTLDRRDGMRVIFRKESLDGGWVGYEVMLVQVARKDVTMGGVLTMKAGSEFLPSDSQWGKKGWSYPTLPEAVARYDRLAVLPTEEDASEEDPDPSDIVDE